MPSKLPISDTTWRNLVEANTIAVASGWAAEGVFGTAIGPDYQPGHWSSILYIGKSAGPLGGNVGSVHDQGASIRASTAWMMEFRNRSAFWQFADKLDPTRRRIAWTNVCKMDRKGGSTPPSGTHWNEISRVCTTALEEELEALQPNLTVFATSNAYRAEIRQLLTSLGYRAQPLPFDDGWTTLYKKGAGTFAVETKHPQGWERYNRDRVIEIIFGLCQPARR